MNPNNPELHLLESIYAVNGEGNAEVPVSQRELAQSAGISLGLTNTLIKRFIERGWVKLMHISGRKIKYALTPAGMEEIAVRAIDYFARAAQYSSLYRKKIEQFVESIAKRGYTALLLLGPAELDFIFEYACLKHGISFYKNLKTCRQEMDSLETELVVISADTLHNLPEDTTKQQLSLPKSVPLIKFSKILSFSSEMEIERSNEARGEKRT